MTSETPNLHISKTLNISNTKQDIEKLKTPLRLVWKSGIKIRIITRTHFAFRGNNPFELEYVERRFENFL